MERKLVTLSSTKRYMKPAEFQVGQKIEGIFQGTSVDEKYGNNKHSIQPETGGDEIILNGCSDLDKQLAKITPGTFVVVTYTGMKQSTGGKFKGKDKHTFTVQYDPDTMKPAAPAPGPAQTTGYTNFAPDTTFPFELDAPLPTPQMPAAQTLTPLQRIQLERQKFNK